MFHEKRKLTRYFLIQKTYHVNVQINAFDLLKEPAQREIRGGIAQLVNALNPEVKTKYFFLACGVYFISFVPRGACANFIIARGKIGSFFI